MSRAGGSRAPRRGRLVPTSPAASSGPHGRRHRQVIVGVRKGECEHRGLSRPSLWGRRHVPPGHRGHSERDKRRPRPQGRKARFPPRAFRPTRPATGGSSSGRCEAKGQTCGCRGVDARRLRLPSRGLRGNRSGAEGVITGSESEGGRQTMCFGSSRVFKSNGICWTPVPFSPSFEQADMCPIHTPLRHPGDLAGRCRRFLLDWDKDDAGRSPANKTRPPARGGADPGTAAKSARATAELRGPRCGHSAPQNGPAPSV